MKTLLKVLIPSLIAIALNACQTSPVSVAPDASVEVYSQNRQGQLLELTVGETVYPVEVIDGLVIFEGDIILGKLEDVTSELSS